jgi:hypothetical protein
MSKFRPQAQVVRGVGTKRAKVIDKNEGRIGFYPCPHCGRFVSLKKDFFARKHDFLGPDRISCPGGRVHPGRFR